MNLVFTSRALCRFRKNISLRLNECEFLKAVEESDKFLSFRIHESLESLSWSKLWCAWGHHPSNVALTLGLSAHARILIGWERWSVPSRRSSRSVACCSVISSFGNKLWMWEPFWILCLKHTKNEKAFVDLCTDSGPPGPALSFHPFLFHLKEPAGTKGPNGSSAGWLDMKRFSLLVFWSLGESRLLEKL